MRDKYFLDTNIFVYSFDANSKIKQLKSMELIKDALINKTGIISYQVIQEFLNVAINKFKKRITTSDAVKYLNAVLLPLCEVFPNISFYEQALEIQNETRFSFYDSLVITAARLSNCSVLYSEDLQHGRIIRDLKIVNPFIK